MSIKLEILSYIIFNFLRLFKDLDWIFELECKNWKIHGMNRVIKKKSVKLEANKKF